MPLIENVYDGTLTPNVYLENKEPDLIYPPIKPFDIELTPTVVERTKIPDNYRNAFAVLQQGSKTPFIPTGESFSTKDSNVFGVQGMSYDPSVDNESLAYLKQNNTLSKGVSGMFDVAKQSFFSQINTIPNFFSSIVTGKDVFKDNEQNRALADSLHALETDHNKIFKSLDQRENPLKFGNIFSRENFGSLLQQTGITAGTIGAILLENLAIKIGEIGLAATGVGAPEAAVIEGANDIRSAIGISKALGSAGKAIKSILGGVSSLSRTYAAARGVNQASKVLRALDLTELGVRAFLHANGEAALQRHIAREDITKALLEQEGENVTQEQLNKIQSIAEEGADTEYMLNLPLLMVSDMYQFGNVLMGKQLNRTLDSFPVSARLVNGSLEFAGKAPTLAKYMMKKAGSFMLKSQVEGLEEIGQYGIEQFTRSYYTDLYNNKTTRQAHDFIKYLGKGGEQMFTEEGINQYISGVLIGGITNVALNTASSVPEIAKNPKRFFSPYSTYKETIENAFDRNNALAENTLKYFSSVAKQNEAFQAEDKATFNDELAKQIFNFTEVNLKRGVYDHVVDTIKSWSELNNEQFNDSGFAGMGESLTPTEQKKYVESILNKVELAKSAIESTQRVFKVNPFENESWFIKKLEERGKTEEQLVEQRLIKIRNAAVFNHLRNVAGYLTFKKEDQTKRLEGLQSELKQSFNAEFVDHMISDNPSIKSFLTSKIREIEDQLAIYTEGIDPQSIASIPGVKENRKRLRNQLDALNSIKDVPESDLTNLLEIDDELKPFIFNNPDVEIPLAQYNKQAEQIIDSFKLKQSVRILNKIYNSWETIEGQKDLINAILKESVYDKTEQDKKDKKERKDQEAQKTRENKQTEQQNNETLTQESQEEETPISNVELSEEAPEMDITEVQIEDQEQREVRFNNIVTKLNRAINKFVEQGLSQQDAAFKAKDSLTSEEQDFMTYYIHGIDPILDEEIDNSITSDTIEQTSDNKNLSTLESVISQMKDCKS